MNRKKIIVFLVTLSLLGLYFSAPVAAETPSVAADPPDEPWLTPGNGERVNITAGNRTQIRTMNGTQIQLRTNESVRLRISESETNPAGPLPNQTRSVNRYMHIELDGTVAMNATMYRNYTNMELSGLGNVTTFRWAFYNTSKFQWQNAYENWVEKTAEGASVFCNTNHFSIWTILATESDEGNPTPGTPFNSQNGTEFAVQAGHQYQIRTQNNFSIQLRLNQSSEISITEHENSPQAMKQNQYQIRTQTFTIEMSNSAAVQANFSYTFTNQLRNQLGIKDMEKLMFMFYNESSETWEAPQHQWLEGDTLYCNTTHFSLWTIAEEVDDDDESTPGLTILPLIFALSFVILLRSRKRE